MTSFWAVVDSVSPLAVRRRGETTVLPVAAGDCLIDPATLTVDDPVRCELSARRVIVVGRAGGVPDATTARKGKVELATNAETIAGTDATRAVTPAGVKAALTNGNTGWASASLGAGVSGSAEWKRENGVIFVRFDVTTSSPVAAGGAVSPAFTLPSAALGGLASGGAGGLSVVSGGTGAASGGVQQNTGNASIRNLHTSALDQFRGTGVWSAT